MPLSLSTDLRQHAIARAAEFCEFCLIHRDAVPDPHEVDHLIARKHGGQSVGELARWNRTPFDRREHVFEHWLVFEQQHFALVGRHDQVAPTRAQLRLLASEIIRAPTARDLPPSRPHLR